MTSTEKPYKTDDPAATARILLAHLGASMIATGQAAHEIESEFIDVADRLGYPQL